VGAICLVVLAWAGRKRFPLQIGAGNFFRRKTQVAIVVAGPLIGTAIITSSYVIQSTFDYTVKVAVFRALDAVDEVVFVPSPEGGRLPFSAQLALIVNEIVRDEGRGAWNDNENLFVPLGTIQTALGEAGQINTITVANVGGVTQGYLRSDDAVREVAPFLPPSPAFTISKAKADSIDGATRNIDQLSQVFVLLGFFTVI